MRHANARAERLSFRLSGVAGVSLMAPTQANAVFATLPEPAICALREKDWRFYTFIGSGGVRFMCGWDTTEANIEALVADVRTACEA